MSYLPEGNSAASNKNRLTLLIEANEVEALFNQKGNMKFECNTLLGVQKETILVC